MNADRVAGAYALLERIVYGGALQRARCCYLDEISPPRKVILLGEGDGRFLEQLLERFPDCAVDVVEPSAKMIARAKARIGGRRDVNFHHCVFEAFQSDGKYDLVVTHFFFDCFDTEGQHDLAAKLVGLTGAGGICLLSDFQIPEKGIFARLRARFLLKVMYAFFGMVSGLKTRELSDSHSALKAAGFRLRERRVMNTGFLRADRWDF